MRAHTSDEPRWVDAILESRWTWPLARVALVSAYVIGGVAKLSDFPAAVAEQEHFGLHPGSLWAVLTIVAELGGSALVIVQRLPKHPFPGRGNPSTFYCDLSD